MVYDAARGQTVLFGGSFNGDTWVWGLGPQLHLGATSLAFGSQKVGTASARKTVTLTNTGDSILNISNLGIGGANSSDFPSTSTCKATLGVGKSCTLSVQFKPSKKGARSANATVSDDSIAGTTQSIALSGTGN